MKTIEQLVDIPSVGFPVWSPSSDAVAYLLDRPGQGWQLWRCDLPSGERCPISERAVAGSRPSWSPDGARLAVVRGNPEGGSDIWLIDSSGSGDETRLVGGAWETRSPSFSPDGATLAFISGEAGSLDIWTVPVTGGAATQLTHGTNPLDEPRWTPRWSPDGAWVAYVSSRSGERNNDDVWVVSADGKTHRQLSTGLMVNTDPAWSPDGSSLAVVANTVMEHWYGDDADVWRIPFAPGSMQQLTPNGGHSWRLEGAGIELVAGRPHDLRPLAAQRRQERHRGSSRWRRAHGSHQPRRDGDRLRHIPRRGESGDRPRRTHQPARSLRPAA